MSRCFLHCSGVSHSMLSDMKTIEQENAQSTTSSLNSLGKLRLSDTESFFDDFSFSSNFNMNRNSNNSYGKGFDSYLSENSSSARDQWIIVDDPPEKSKTSYSSSKPGSLFIYFFLIWEAYFNELTLQLTGCPNRQKFRRATRRKRNLVAPRPFPLISSSTTTPLTTRLKLI